MEIKIINWPKNILKKISWRWITKFLYGLITIILVIIAGTIALSALNLPNGIRLYTVQTGSMAPTIPAGSLVIIKPFNNYKKGDIITYPSEKYRTAKNPRETVTHRIFAVRETKKAILYITKGDFNPSPDFAPIPRNLVLGKVIASVPVLGFPLSFAKTSYGFILLIVIPATIIIYSELMTIKNEAIRLIAERKKRKLTTKEKIEEKIGEEIIMVEKELKKDIKKIEKTLEPKT